MIYKLILWGESARQREFPSAFGVITLAGGRRLPLVRVAKLRGSLTLTFAEET